MVMLACARSPAQSLSPTPFYYASPTQYDRQARTLIVGANQSVGQAIVSQDRRTLNLDPSLLGSAGIRGFSYQKSGRGFVGDEAASTPSPAAGNGLTPTIKSSPSDIGPELSILDRPGMFLIAPLERQ